MKLNDTKKINSTWESSNGWFIFDEPFAHEVKMRQMFLIVASWKVHQIEVHNTFFHEMLDIEVYMMLLHRSAQCDTVSYSSPFPQCRFSKYYMRSLAVAADPELISIWGIKYKSQ